MALPKLEKYDDTGTTTTLSYIQLGGDDLADDVRRDRAGVVNSRYGVPVDNRVWTNVRVWNLNINHAPQAHIEALRTYFEDGKCYLYPDGDIATKYSVFWIEDSFNPQFIKPGYYSLKATLKQTKDE